MAKNFSSHNIITNELKTYLISLTLTTHGNAGSLRFIHNYEYAIPSLFETDKTTNAFSQFRNARTLFELLILRLAHPSQTSSEIAGVKVSVGRPFRC